jgi:hypothetical protein
LIKHLHNIPTNPLLNFLYGRRIQDRRAERNSHKEEWDKTWQQQKNQDAARAYHSP